MKTLRIKLVPLLLALGTFTLGAQAQVEAVLTAETAASTLTKGAQVTAKLSVRIDPGWHISSLTTPDGGPVKTEIRLNQNQPFKLAGKIDAPDPIRRHSDAFGVDVETYEGEVVFTLPLEVTASVPAGIKVLAEITYQACNEQTCNLPRSDKLAGAVTLRVAKDPKAKN